MTTCNLDAPHITRATMPSTFDGLTEVLKPFVDSELRRYVSLEMPDNRSMLEQAMTYSLLAGGKRFRPILVFASFLLFSNDIKKIAPLACAIEMSHTYSLIHDDLPAMDDDDLRRGSPTCHVKFGEDVAILAGDTLNTFAYEVLTKDLRTHYSSDLVLEAVLEFSRAQGIHGMAGGQMLDLAGELGQTGGDLQKIHELKTGKIIESCLVLPALLEGAPNDIRQSLENFGKIIGLLFQITDDILDVEGTSHVLGKTQNKDQEANKLTYVTHFGLDTAKKMALDCGQQGKAIARDLDYDIFESIIDFLLQRTF